jgi:HK97 family phage prohead protease
MPFVRDYEIAGGGGGGSITHIDHRSIAPPTFDLTAEVKADDDKRNVLIGYSYLWNQVVIHNDGRYMLIRPGAFGDVMDGKERYFTHSHDLNIKVGSTRQGLTLFQDDVGLAFKLYLPRTVLGRETRDMVRDNVRQAMSIGFTATKTETTTVEDSEITLVVEAELHEIALCEYGRNDDAFAVLVADGAEWVTDMCKSMRMTDEMHRAHLGRIKRRLEALH